MPPRWFPQGASGGASAPTSITFVAGSTFTSSGATATIPWPAGVKDGDYIFGLISNGSGSGAASTNGMARVYPDVTTGAHTYVFDHRYTTGDPAGGIIFGGIQSGTTIGMGAWRGTNQNWDVSLQFGSIYLFVGSTATPTSNANTTKVANSVGILFTVWNGGSVISAAAASGYTQRVTLASTSTAGGLDIEDIQIPTPQANAAAHVTLSGAVASAVGLIAVQL